MNRRGFLGSILAGAIAPAIVRASSLMKLAPGLEELESGIVVPEATITTGNQLLTISYITNEALRVFVKQQTFVDSVSKSYAWVEPGGERMTIRIRKTG